MSAAASLSVTSGLPLGVGIGWSNRRFHPRSATGLDRLAQPLHREFNVFGLKVAPAFGLCEIAVFREALEIFRCKLFSGVAGRFNFSSAKLLRTRSGHKNLASSPAALIDYKCLNFFKYWCRKQDSNL